MRPLRDLLTNWENWSARDTLNRALSRASTDDTRQALRRRLAETPEVDSLDALRDVTELVALLSAWQWRAVHAARVRGVAWEEIGNASGTTAEQARDRFMVTIESIASVRPGLGDELRGALEDSA